MRHHRELMIAGGLLIAGATVQVWGAEGPPDAVRPSAQAGRSDQGQERLDAPHPIDWRGVPLRNVLNDLSRDIGVPYLLDRSVKPEAMDQRLRLFADHLTGRQAFRWAARLAGLEAVVRDNLVLVASPQQLPRTWRLTGGGSPAGVAVEEERLREVSERRISVTWIDTPLSGVGRDISAGFRIDAIFHPGIVLEEPLVHLEQAEATLDTVRKALEGQLHAKTAVFDGALWVTPVNMDTAEPATQPVSAPAARSPGQPARLAVGPLEQYVIVDQSVRNWQELCDRLSGAAGVNCRIIGTAGTFGPPFEARGAVGEVLESARLLGRLASWRLGPGAGSKGMIEIRPVRGDR